jgi:hypothetical protein
MFAVMPAAGAVPLLLESTPTELLVLLFLLALVLAGAAVLGVLLLRKLVRDTSTRPETSSSDADGEQVALLRELLEELAALRRALVELPRQAAPPTGAGAPDLVGPLVAAHAELGDRLEAAVESLGESLAREREVALVAAPPAPALFERVTDRLHALGYERVQIVTDSEHLDEIAAGDGDVLVEAARQGVLHKGRVRVRSGLVAGVDVHPTYSIFP